MTGAAGGGGTGALSLGAYGRDGMPQLIEVNFDGGDPSDNWTLTIASVPQELGVEGSTTRLDPKLIEDCCLIVSYAVA